MEEYVSPEMSICNIQVLISGFTLVIVAARSRFPELTCGRIVVARPRSVVFPRCYVFSPRHITILVSEAEFLSSSV